MFSLIFTTLGQGKSVAKEFGEAWSAVFSKTNNEAIKFSEDFTTALNKNIGYINDYKNAVDGGMSETEAMAKHLASASTEAKEYAASTNVAEISTEQFARSQKSAEIATAAQTKSLTNIRTIINTYNAGADKLGLTTDEFNKSVKESNGSLGTYLSSLNGAKASMGGYIKSLVSAKLSTIALSVASAALNAAISFGISVVIQGLITGISELVHREEKLIEKSEEAKSAIQSINDELKENSKTVNDTSERFATLAQKVEDLGKLTQNKGTLSTEEYEEFLDLSNQLAGVFPELTKGYDDNGNAILNLSGDVNTIVSSLDDLIDRQKQLANQEIIKQLPDLYGGFTVSVENARAEVKSAKTEFDRINDAYKELSKYGSRTFMFDIGGNLHDADGKVVDNINNIRSLASALGLVVKETQKYDSVNMYGAQQWVGTLLEIEGSVDDNFTSKLENARKNLQYAKDNLESELSSIGSYINTWLQGEWMYNKIDDTGLQAAVQQMLLSFDPSALPEGVDSNNWEAVSDWIRKNILFAISNIDNEEVSEAISKLFSGDNLSLKDLEGFIEQIKNYFGEDSPVYLFIKPKFDENGDGVIDAKELAEEVKKKVKDEFDDQVDELSIDDLGIASSDEFWKFLGVPDGTLLSWNELCASIKRFKKESSEINPLEITAEDTVKNLNDLSKGFEQLDKIYKDVIDGNGFDVSLIADNKDFKKKFSGLDSYTDFLATIVKYPNDIKKCQDAFNQLTNEYIRQSGVLDILNEDNKELVANYLRAMGVENASAIVEAELAYQKEKLKYSTESYIDATLEEINTEYNSASASEVTKQALAELWLQKVNLNTYKIDASSDIDQIINMANAANAAAASISALRQAKNVLSAVEKGTAAGFHMIESGDYDKALKTIEQINNGTFNYNFQGIDSSKYKSAVYSGADKTYKELAKQDKSSESAANKAAKAAKDAFQNEYNAHKHKVQMELESEKSYYDWLEKRSKEVYDQKIIDEGDYWKYQEEVFDGRRKLYQDYLNDIEHEISMRQNMLNDSEKVNLKETYGKELTVIRSLYKTLISSVESEIAKARKGGLKDTDEYLQSLQDKWSTYRKAIQEIENDAKNAAKDALDELVDYRIDMLKKDVDKEKDALDKKLDNLKEFYDKQKEMLQDAADEEKYLDEQSEKRKSVTDIQSQLAQLEYDNSAWAEKRKAELKQELADAQKELDDFEKDHALELALDAIDDAYNSQEAQLKREMDALDEKLNDPNALYNQALTDIKNNSKNQLYYTMLMYNRQYGDGKDSTVNDMWTKAYGALDDYQKLFGKAYDGVTLKNETGVKQTTTTWDTAKVSGTSSANKTTTSATSATTKTTSTKSSSPSLSNGSSVTIKKTATNFSSKSKGVRMASFVPGGTYTVYQTSGNEVLIGRNGVYTGWVNKSDIVGYATGTKRAKAGIHEIDEEGYETIFESADGARYKLFSGSEKVLNAKASDFLYDFANGGGEILEKIIKSALGGGIFDKIMPVVNKNEINMGDIVIQGDCKEKTVSEIRRAQRENVSNMLKAFNNLNK